MRFTRRRSPLAGATMVRLDCGPTITPTITALSSWTPTVIALRQSAMRRKAQSSMPQGEALPSEVQVVTVKTRNAAIELLARFSREEEFVTPLSRIAEHFDLMIADPSCWSAHESRSARTVGA
jgi:hypothetical protein